MSNDFDNEIVTQEIPRETMDELNERWRQEMIERAGRPTRDLRRGGHK